MLGLLLGGRGAGDGGGPAGGLCVGRADGAEEHGQKRERASGTLHRMTMPRPGYPCHGGCVCGAVRYRLLEEPLELHVCHCTDCQRLTGTAFVLTMAIQRPSLEVERGETQVLSFETPEGIARRDHRCPGCGSRLWSEPPKLPEILSLRPGTLDDTSWLRPIAHIWTASAQPWVPVPEPSEDLLVYERQPEDDMELVRAWRRYRKRAASAG